ncbi:MAG: ATP-binding cassette domain-containing protein [Anaerolineae bacterium]|nr:ATP-binding cassette domain-containing protein [Anaerolineae bacterium]
MLETQKLIKVFGFRPILRSVDLSVVPGECLILFGANGAGKTTLLRILATPSRPPGGSVSVAGRSLPARQPPCVV